MDYLAERGIDNKFAQQLSDFATHYEHAQYVALLQKIRDFAGKNWFEWVGEEYFLLLLSVNMIS